MAIDWRNEPVIDSVQLPGSETKYWVQDTEAREKIETLANATHFIGVSTTEITDGGTEKPTINEEEVNPVAGDIVIWKPLTGAPLEFIWDGSKWNLLGGQALEGLGDLAFKDSASGSYTPRGSIDFGDLSEVVTNVDFNSVTLMWSEAGCAVPSDINIDSSSITIPMDLSGYVSTDSYYTLYGDSSDMGSYLYDYTTGEVEILTSFNAGTLPTLSLSSTLTASISGKTLVFTLASVSFSAGTLPTAESSTITYVEDCSSRNFSMSEVGGEFPVHITYNMSTVDVVTNVEPDYSNLYIYGLGDTINFSSINASFDGEEATIEVS